MSDRCSTLEAAVRDKSQHSNKGAFTKAYTRLIDVLVFCTFFVMTRRMKHLSKKLRAQWLVELNGLT